MPARTLPPSLSRPARDMDIRYGDVDVGTIAQQDWNANPKVWHLKMDLRLLWDHIEPRRRHPQSVLQRMPEIPERDDANRRS